MSFGDHLEELRARLILAMIGFGASTAVCLIFGKRILALICAPLWSVQTQNGLTPQLQVLSPTAAFTAYLKIALLSGLILSMPWVVYQIWRFVASGLYQHERKFVRLAVPATSGLFVLGVLFLYTLVLPVVLQFFVRFNSTFRFDDPLPVANVAGAVGGGATAPMGIPLLDGVPSEPSVGAVWVDMRSRRLMVKTPDAVWSTSLEVGETASTMHSQFAIDFYITFVLLLALGFGIAFETPVVVFFLARTGLVPTRTMRRARRYVILGTVVLAAALTPPDVISQLLLAGPMYLLFEAGLVTAAMVERKASGEETVSG